MIRRISVRAENGALFLRLSFGLGTTPLTTEYAIDPATALVLSHQLEAAVHAVCPAGLTPTFTDDQPTNPS